MKKYRILTAVSALALAGSLLAAPFGASAAVTVPRVYRYYAFGAMKYLLYDTKNQNWYSETGEALSVTQTDRQQVRFQGQIYTADFAEMKVYDADNKEIPVLSNFLIQMQECARRNLSISVSDPKDGTVLPDSSALAAKPVYLKSDIENENSNIFAFYVYISGTDGCFGCVYLMRDDSMIDGADLDGENAAADTLEHWHVDMGVWDCAGKMESYTETGDTNIDGKFSVTDSVLLARAAAEDETANISELGLVLADMDNDGELTVLDVTASLKALAGNEKEG